MDHEALPACYLKAVPDTLAIRRALARGEEIPGVERVRSELRAACLRSPR